MREYFTFTLNLIISILLKFNIENILFQLFYNLDKFKGKVHATLSHPTCPAFTSHKNVRKAPKESKNKTELISKR